MMDPADSPRRSATPAESAKPAPAFPVVAIGASAGGLHAFRKLLEHLPPDTKMAYVLIPHLDPTHESIMSEILSRTAKVPVEEVKPGMRVEPDHAYVIRPNTLITISGDRLEVSPRGGIPGRRQECISHFMISLAQEYRDRAIGVILSGTASDGSLGIESIKAEGGITFAQDDSAEFKDMPRNAVATGAVDFVLSPEGIAAELARISRHPYLARPRPAPVRDPERKPPVDGLEDIFRLLRGATGMDFASYKRSTIERRIARRMALARKETLADYLRMIESDPREVRVLHDELLINVTSFFREPEAFEILKTKVVPRLLKNRPAHDPVRVWVPGCSSGEEAYSIAIALLEGMEEKGPRVEIQLFGTDVSERAIEKARSGIYEAGIRNDVSPDRLRRFFARTENGGYQIAKSVRDLCVFARQDVTRDPPFSRIDLLSCRNLLIYLGAGLQQRVIPLFHYALKPGGFLLLGSSESVERYAALFAPFDKTCRIYSKIQGSAPPPAPFAAERAFPRTPAAAARKDDEATYDVGKALDRLLLDQYVPAAIVVNEQGQVVEVRGETGPFLRPAPGKPGLSVLKMVRDDLVVELDHAVREARRKGARVLRRGLRFRFEQRVREAEIEVVPLAAPKGEGRTYLVLFREAPPSPQEAGSKKRTKARVKEGADVDRLRAELAAAREYQKSVVERLEGANEELRSSSEETLSANEELQSTNEELETSKEELQSANEELTTLNEELRHKNLELGEINSDLANVLAGANVPLVIVDANLRLRRVTSQAEKLLSTQPGDLGRKITDFKLSLQIPDLEEVLRGVIDTLVPVDREARDVEGRWHSLRVRPYRTADNRIDGAVVTFIDIDDLKRSLIAIEEGRALIEIVLDTVPDALLILGSDLRVERANRTFLETFQLEKEEVEGRLIYDCGNRQWDIPRLRILLQEVIPKNSRFDRYEVEHEFPRIGHRVMLLNARQVMFRTPSPPRILLVIEDITERKDAETRLRRHLEITRTIAENAESCLALLDPEGRPTFVNPAFERVTGRTLAELEGRSLHASLHARRPDGSVYPEGECPIHRAATTLATLRNHEDAYVRKDGSVIPMSCSVAPFKPDGKAGGVVLEFRDITERRRADEAIRSLNESLERRVKERTLELEGALKNLDAFSYTVSHDLRAPLRAMNSYAQILIDDYAGKTLDQTGQDYARRVAEAARRMDHLVQDLLEYSRLAREDIPLERVDVRTVLVDVLTAMERELAERKAEVLVEEPVPDVLGHRSTLGQAFTNLISNAAKFVAPGVRPRVRVRGELRDGWVRFWVEDNGIGIPLEHQGRIFGVFERLHKQEEYPGTGIGLAIVRKALDRMDGRIGVESDVGRGSRFWLELPAAR